jgi:hypothetical protein
MKSKLSLVILIQAFIIVMLFWVLVFYGKDEYEALTQGSEEEIESPTYVETVDGKTSIEVNEATQVQSGITTAPLTSISYSENILSYGNAISISSLVDLRARYLGTKADELIVLDALGASKQHYERMVLLNNDNKNVADKVVTTAQNEMRAHQTKLTALQSNASNIADSMRQQWGNALTNIAIQKGDSTLFKQLIQNQRVLIQITLPFTAHTPSKGTRVQIAPTSALQNVVSAEYFSPAPTSNTTMQGKTYFYHAKADFLRAGMPVKVLDFDKLGEPLAGVFIPNEAVVWYAGRPWVYQKQDGTEFVRLPIHNDHEVEDGWFYQGVLKADDLIVTSGAQLLLSEEFKYQITNETDD